MRLRPRLICALCLAALAGDLPAARLTVVGIDRTASFTEMTHAALTLAEPYFWQASPGDLVIGRWISDRSYADDQTLVRMELPGTPVLAEARNRFDRRAQTLRQAQMHSHQEQVTARKVDALRVLRAQCVGETPSTDVSGFVMAGSEVIRQSGADFSERVLVLITDLEDNRRFTVAPDLTGVRVHVQLIGGQADPEQAARLRDSWGARFRSWGAQDVEFERPAVPPVAEDPSCRM